MQAGRGPGHAVPSTRRHPVGTTHIESLGAPRRTRPGPVVLDPVPARGREHGRGRLPAPTRPLRQRAGRADHADTPGRDRGRGTTCDDTIDEDRRPGQRGPAVPARRRQHGGDFAQHRVVRCASIGTRWRNGAGHIAPRPVGDRRGTPGTTAVAQRFLGGLLARPPPAVRGRGLPGNGIALWRPSRVRTCLSGLPVLRRITSLRARFRLRPGLPEARWPAPPRLRCDRSGCTG